MRKKQLENESQQRNLPVRDDNKRLASTSKGCLVIQANQRPPGGSITVHHGILTPPWDEKTFMGMWMCVIE